VIRGLLAADEAVDVVVSRAARLTLIDETGSPFRDGHWREDLREWLERPLDRGKPEPFKLDDVRYWTAGDFAAGPSSGSYPAKGMIVVPCSAAAVAGIAIGLSKDLLQRAANVTLKERRPLVLCVRESPLNGMTLRQLADLDQDGAVVIPASPGFYAGSVSVQQLVDFVAGRVLDAVKIEHSLYRRWEGELRPK
jgi:4-hydroxy-3-polyprenylbenzoate decarboxylase